MTEKYDLSRRKVLGGMATIGVAGAGAGLGTSALYSDEETFVNNQITAGTTNLAVTMGLVNIDSSAPDSLDVNYEVGESRTADGEARIGIQVGDMKPGDCITLRTTVDVEDNPMYVGVIAENVEQDGGDYPEPEQQDEDDDNNSGDLGEALEFTFGYDTDRSSLHDNSLEGSLEPDEGSSTVSGAEFLALAEDDTDNDGLIYRGRNGATGDPPGGHAGGDAPPTRIGDNGNADRDKVTHFVEICLPAEVGNEVQGDSVSFDLVYVAEQVRNNPDPSTAADLDGEQNPTES
jgi:predicted ribosomally synthesized peptide with SipW-like signal peptide